MNTHDRTRHDRAGAVDHDDRLGDGIEPTELERAWHDHVGGDPDFLDRLITRHRERQRRYHKVGHVEAVIRHVNELVGTETVDDLGAVIAAAFYHDAIYEPTHPANERASARLARRDLSTMGWDESRAEVVASMIEGTRSHTDPPTADAAVLFDADLAILGAEPDAYKDYVTKTRAEYSHLDDREWSVGRATVLQNFLDREHIFATTSGRDRWDAVARSNITGELKTLQS